MGTIKRVEARSLTVMVQRKEGRKKTTEEKTFEAAEDCRVYLGRYNKATKAIEAGEEIAGGLSNPAFAKIPDGLAARILVDGASQKVVQVRLFQVKGK